jgi:hypothetical protein
MNEFIFKFDQTPRRKKGDAKAKKASIYIPVSDGVKIAAEIILPKNVPDGTRFPTLFVQTRYWRAHQFRPLFRWILGDQVPMVQHIINWVISYGYAIVYTDVRGSGASMGTYKIVNTQKEFSDCKEIMDWIITQAWSDGNIITWGISYLGLTAEFAGIHGHPALKGVMPMHDYWDILADVGAPGGVPNVGFLKVWSAFDQSLDRNSIEALVRRDPLVGLVAHHVKPVASDTGMVMEAMKDHEKNVYPFSIVNAIKYRDDPIDDEGTDITRMCIYAYKDMIEKAGVPYYVWVSWHDAGVADGALARFLSISNRQRVVIGDWNHGAMARANPFLLKQKKVVPKQKEQFVEWSNYFDRCVAGEIPDEKAIYYYTLVENRWKRTETWPPTGCELQAWYLSKDHGLLTNPPDDESGADEYRVDFDATTGTVNRWSAGMGYRIRYPNRAKKDDMLLVYMSQPLEQDMEITGNAIVTLHMASTHEDGIVIVYLEDVNEKGYVTYVTEGELRLIQRKPASPEDLPYRSNIQFHTFLKQDGSPMLPGKIAEITFGLLSTSVLIRKGHRLRVAIAGADKDSFERIPTEGIPTLTIARDKDHPSCIELPVIPRNSLGE